MSAGASVIASFVAEDTSAEDSFLLLEQQEYDDGVGVVTQLDVIRSLSGAMLGSGDTAGVDCGVDGETGSFFSSSVYAYPFPATLSYSVGMTWGTYVRSGREVVTMRENLSFSFDTGATLRYPVRSVISAAWLGPVYDESGSMRVAPSIDVNGRDVTIDSPVYGTMEVAYSVMRDVWGVRVTTRESTHENIFQSVFYGRWDGGIILLSVAAPENAEDSYLNNTDCTGGGGYGASLFVTDPDPEYDEPTADPVNQEILLDYCTDFGNDE